MGHIRFKKQNLMWQYFIVIALDSKYIKSNRYRKDRDR